MSTPPFLSLPECATPVTFTGAAGPLAGVRADPGGAGPARGDVLLVPGFTGSKEDFIAVLEPLARLGWRVTSYDQRGQYESQGPDDAAAYTLDRFADDLAAVAAALPGPVHAVGHSFGGLVARQTALRAGAGGLASLVLLCSGPGPAKAEDRVGLSFVRDQLPGLDLGQLYDLSLAYTGTTPPPGAVGRFLRHRYTSNNPTCLGAIAGLLLSVPDRTDDLAALAASGFPVAVAYGDGDDAWPLAEQDRVARACGGASHVIAAAGHSPAVDQPQATAALLDRLCAG